MTMIASRRGANHKAIMTIMMPTTNNNGVMIIIMFVIITIYDEHHDKELVFTPQEDYYDSKGPILY